MFRSFLVSFFLGVYLLTGMRGVAQCINLFPATETFENTNGGWVTGGVASDWSWGVAVKPVVNSLGSKCWVTGGLTRSAYNDGENSWLQTRCYDFSSLANPRVSFKVFWETERRFDGAALQYSIDGGNTWQLVGSINSNASCDGVNWYNFTPITYLGGSPGWSGNVQSNSGSCLGGGGSGAWLTAMHKLSFLAGEPSVFFRFVFGAGTQCNAYDGFAIDDFDIREIPLIPSAFTYTCGEELKVSFFSEETFCQQNVQWNFGDVASGANNFSGQQNPVHVFSQPGTYTVQLIVNTSNNPPSVSNQTITVLGITTAVLNPLSCFGDTDGSITVSQVSPPGTYQYVWNTSPPQTSATLSNLPAGSYSVVVSSPSACSSGAQVNLVQPPAISVGSQVSPATCTASSGSIQLNVSGGVSPYTYSWSGGQQTPSISSLDSGSYSVEVKDANGCSTGLQSYTVSRVNNPVSVSLGANRFICPGQTLVLNPGNYAAYLWQDGSTAPFFTVSSTGVYQVDVSDANGCTGSASVTITVDCSEIWFPSAFTPSNTRNNTFGALGNNLSAVTGYKLEVFNRAGQVIFTTTDPFHKWAGSYKGDPLPTQSFAWQVVYQYRGRNYSEKGNLLLIR